MANHASAKKRHRQNLKKRASNRDARSTIRTSVKTALTLAAEGKREEAIVAAKATTRLLDKAVVHGLLHKNNAARKISRLHRNIASVSSSASA